MYSISKKILFQNKLFIGDNIVSDGSFVIKKSAIKNIKKLNTVESAIEWINEPNFYVISASTEKERAFLSSVSGVFKHEVYEFKRSKILLDRGENSPVSVFICPELGVIKFLDDEYTFNLKLEVLYSSEDSHILVDAPNIEGWNIALSCNSKPVDFDSEIEVLSTILFSENFVENV